MPRLTKEQVAILESIPGWKDWDPSKNPIRTTIRRLIGDNTEFMSRVRVQWLGHGSRFIGGSVVALANSCKLDDELETDFQSFIDETFSVLVYRAAIGNGSVSGVGLVS